MSVNTLHKGDTENDDDDDNNNNNNNFFLALQPTVGFSLLSDFLPFCSFFTLLSPPSYLLTYSMEQSPT
jgi:hypothetical protein